MKYLVSEQTEEAKNWVALHGHWAPAPRGMKTHNYVWKTVPKDAFSSCCGSRISSVENFGPGKAGVLVAFSKDKIELPVDTGEYTYHQVEGDGEWINIALYHGNESFRGADYYNYDNFGNAHSLYTAYFNAKTDEWPDGVYLLVLTKDQDHTHLLKLAEARQLRVEWTSPPFANHNYGDDSKRLTMYVLRKGEKK